MHVLIEVISAPKDYRQKTNVGIFHVVYLAKHPFQGRRMSLPCFGVRVALFFSGELCVEPWVYFHGLEYSHRPVS